MKVIVTAQARLDLQEIWGYIAGDSNEAADRFIDEVTQALKLLGEHPLAGRSRSDLGYGIRNVPVKRYILLYRLEDDGVRVIRVIHGARDLDTVWDSPDN